MGTAYSSRGLPLGHQWRLSRGTLAGKKGRPLTEVVWGGKGPSAGAGTEAQKGIKGKKKTGRGWGPAGPGSVLLPGCSALGRALGTTVPRGDDVLAGSGLTDGRANKSVTL